MIDYGISNISYKSQLPTTTVRLPLKYPQQEGNHHLTVADDFTTKISQYGEFIHPSSFINNISVDILHDLKTINLTPLRTSLDEVEYQRITIELPHGILPGCYAINLMEEPDKDPKIIIDLLDDNYLFINIIIDLDKFIVGSTFDLNNFNHWGHISVPYSFELRSKPFKFKSLNMLNFIISLDDGGLLHFHRKRVLSDFDIYNFDTFSLLGWFKQRQDERVVDMILDSDGDNNRQQLITLNTNKVLKFWDLTKHELKSSISLINNNYLSPNNYFQTIDGEIFFHTTNSFEIDHEITFYSLKNGKLQNFKISSPLKLWYVQDFKIIKHSRDSNINDHHHLSLYILWKSNISTMVIHYSLSSNYKILAVKSQNLTNDTLPEDLKNYDDLIINTSINTVREKLNLPLVTNVNNVIITDTIEKLGKPGLLNSICEEYKTLSHEGIALDINHHGVEEEEIIVLQTNGFGIIRPLSYFEKFITTDIAKIDGLSGILNKLDIYLSTKTIDKIFTYFSNVKTVKNDELLKISEISNIKLPFDEITNILNNHPNIINTLDKLLIEKINGHDSLETKDLPALDKFILLRSIKDLIKNHKVILTKLLIILSNLDSESNELPLKYAIIIHEIFTKFAIIDAVDNLIINLKFPETSIINQYYYILNVANEQDFILSLIGQLLKNKQWSSVYQILDKIDNNYLVGLIYLLNNDPRGLNHLNYENYLDCNLDFGSLGFESFQGFNDKGKYYHHLSSFISSRFPKEAIEYELKAIENGNEDYESLFNLTISVSNSLEASTLIKALLNLTESLKFKSFLKITILKLIELNSIKEIFNHSFFISQYKLIDLILNELIDSSDLITSIKFYEIIYSWRINQGDKRGGVEILYKFIKNFNLDSLDREDLKLMYLKILEFYLIIMNVLKSFKNNNEKWLLSDNIVNLKQINLEYNNYLNKLNEC